MAFAKDVDLVRLEPELFAQVVWTGPVRLEASDASIAGNTLTAPTSDLEAALVEAGHVAVADGVPLEVIERLSSTTATVGPIRSAPGDPASPAPISGGIAALRVSTFRPQIELVHAQLLGSVGIDPGDSGVRPGEGDIVNTAALARVEALGALHLIFTAAATTLDNADALWARAQMHRRRFAAERARVGVALDLDGDGRADAVRRFNTLGLVRS